MEVYGWIKCCIFFEKQEPTLLQWAAGHQRSGDAAINNSRWHKKNWVDLCRILWGSNTWKALFLAQIPCATASITNSLIDAGFNTESSVKRTSNSCFLQIPSAFARIFIIFTCSVLAWNTVKSSYFFVIISGKVAILHSGIMV